MTQSSPILSLPYLMPSQAQKHVTHNEALEALDLLVQLRVLSFDDTVPPATPAEGDVYVPAAGAVSDWAGRDDQIAIWRDAMWDFVAPQAGWRAWDAGSGRMRVWDGAAWTIPAGATDNLPQLGVGTSGDATNVLAVRGPATLLTNDGAGHQVKVNKASAGDTASLLFQSGWTGHAEMGLAGDTDFSVKVSADGSTWANAMVLAAATGQAGFGTGAPAARVHVADSGAPVLRAEATGTGFTGAAMEVEAERSANAAFDFARFTSSGQGDVAFAFGGDGNAACDGSWTGGGADYAEYFEWADGNPQAEDRRGVSVVLDGAMIRPAAVGEEPFGIVSGNPSVIGDGDAAGWKGKYLRDDFGGYVLEGGQRVENPDHDPEAVYVARADRPEWAVVGLMGKLRLQAGQPVGARWLRMRAVSDTVEEWLVR